nr:hypothetical protein FICFSXYB_FICFSXYB_CDS_0009 [Microvirus sp.]
MQKIIEFIMWLIQVLQAILQLIPLFKKKTYV